MARYVLSLLPLASFSLVSLPSLFIDTGQVTIPDNEIDCTLVVSDSATNSSKSYDAFVQLQGHSTPQGYFITTQSISSILDFPNHTMWVLKASDRTFLRDALAFEIGRRTGEYAPRTRFVKLYIDDVARGVYVLEEKVAVGSSRVAIGENGVLVKMDDDDYAFRFNLTQCPIEIEYSNFPSGEIDISTNRFEALLLGANWLYEPSYHRYVDHTNWANYFLLTEIARSLKAYSQGVYMYSHDITQTSPVFLIGPGWDFNIAFGDITMPGNLAATQGWHYVALLNTLQSGVTRWFHRMLADVSFKRTVVDRWTTLRQGGLSDTNLTQLLASFTAELTDSLMSEASWSQATNQLTAWLLARVHWMDGAISGLPYENVIGPGTACSPGQSCGPGTSMDDHCLETPFLPVPCSQDLINSPSNESRCSQLRQTASCPIPLQCKQDEGWWTCLPPQSLTIAPSSSPSNTPSNTPTNSPNLIPSALPSKAPSRAPSKKPSPALSAPPTELVDIEEENNTATILGAVGGISLLIALSYLCFRRKRKRSPVIRPDSFSYDPVSMHYMGSYDNMPGEPLLASFDTTSEVGSIR